MRMQPSEAAIAELHRALAEATGERPDRDPVEPRPPRPFAEWRQTTPDVQKINDEGANKNADET